MSIEKFLSRATAKKYTSEHHGAFRVFFEAFASEKKLKEIYDNEIGLVEKLRKDIRAALSENSDDQKKYAERWAHFLKPRVTVLKFWSTLCTAFMAIYALGGSLFTILGSATGQNAPAVIFFVFLLISSVLLIAKYIADKRAFWYEYLIANLDAISKL